MAKLIVKTHSNDYFELVVDDEPQQIRLTSDEWWQFAGVDGKRLVVHSKSVAYILRTPSPEEAAAA